MARGQEVHDSSWWRRLLACALAVACFLTALNLQPAEAALFGGQVAAIAALQDEGPDGSQVPEKGTPAAHFCPCHALGRPTQPAYIAPRPSLSRAPYFVLMREPLTPRQEAPPLPPPRH